MATTGGSQAVSPDTGLIRKLSSEIADQKIQACQQTSEVRNASLNKSLGGIEQTALSHGRSIADLTTQVALLNQSLASQRWWVRTVVVLCLSTFVATAGTCIKVNGYTIQPTATAADLEIGDTVKG